LKVATTAQTRWCSSCSNCSCAFFRCSSGVSGGALLAAGEVCEPDWPVAAGASVCADACRRFASGASGRFSGAFATSALTLGSAKSSTNATAASLRPARPLMAGTCDTLPSFFRRLLQRFRHEFHSESWSNLAIFAIRSNFILTLSVYRSGRRIRIGKRGPDRFYAGSGRLPIFRGQRTCEPVVSLIQCALLVRWDCDP
jgi:hypothetical protein